MALLFGLPWFYEVNYEYFFDFCKMVNIFLRWYPLFFHDTVVI